MVHLAHDLLLNIASIVIKRVLTIVDAVNSASHFEFKLNKRGPCNGDKNLGEASRVKGTKV